MRVVILLLRRTALTNRSSPSSSSLSRPTTSSESSTSWSSESGKGGGLRSELVAIFNLQSFFNARGGNVKPLASHTRTRPVVVEHQHGITIAATLPEGLVHYQTDGVKKGRGAVQRGGSVWAEWPSHYCLLTSWSSSSRQASCCLR